jgi:hypothetical protein
MQILVETYEMETVQRLAGSFTIPEWCRYRKTSVSMFYKLRAQGKAPRTLPIGRRQTITAEADEKWVREQQALASNKSKNTAA